MSLTLHGGMISHVLSSPIPFFDATPRGRILNRFSVDLDAVDSRLYLSSKITIQNSLLTLAKLAVVGTQAPLVIAVGAVAGVILIFLVVSAVASTFSNNSFSMAACPGNGVGHLPSIKCDGFHSKVGDR